VIARLGGDEFAILTIDTSQNNIDVIHSRLQSNVDSYNLVSVRGYSLSFSLGVMQVDLSSTFTVDALLSQADKAMYEHKNAKKAK
jgi:diguanylate cyclase (GGDEF)-like protein